MTIFLLNNDLVFPHAHLAEKEGIIAIGGDLSPERILLAYSKGIFPWFNEDDPIIWWSPDPRMILFPNEIKVSTSMKKVLRSNRFSVTFNTAFKEVINNCREVVRKGQKGTWISPAIVDAYCKLHDLGFAQSAEVWNNDGELVGGIYGVSLGKCFFGESMFSTESNASKTGFITLVNKLNEEGFELIDCQVYTKHLASLGAKNVDRKQFLRLLENVSGPALDLVYKNPFS